MRIYVIQRMKEQLMSTRQTGVLFPPSISYDVDDEANNTYVPLTPFTHDELREARENERSSNIHDDLHRWSVRSKEFMALEKGRKYELSAALVEPPAWRKLSKQERSEIDPSKRMRLEEEGAPPPDELLTPAECAASEQWLEKRKHHPGFFAILHYRQSFDDPRVVLMDPFACSLMQCLPTAEFRIQTLYPHQKRPDNDDESEVDPAGNRLLPNPNHPLGQAVTQVLQGLHYLAHVAKVRYGRLHPSHVVRNAVGRWCIMNFEKSSRHKLPDAASVVSEDFSDFAEEVLQHTDTDWRVAGYNASVHEFLDRHYGKWLHHSYATVRERFNGICPFLGDLLLLFVSRMVSRENPDYEDINRDFLNLPSRLDLMQHVVDKAMREFPNWTVALEALPPSSAAV